jgi:uncharacterized protein (PEP-CTERM system associated)
MIDPERGIPSHARSCLAGAALSLSSRCALTLTAATSIALCAAPAAADQWRVTPGVRAAITYTDNLEAATPGAERGSGVATVTPRVNVDGRGRRYTVNGSFAISGNYYTNGTNNSSYYTTLNLFGNVEAIERFFFVDGGVNILQNYLSPFGPITISNELDTANRYTTYVYRLNPYVQGQLAGGTNYLLRWNNMWTDYSRSGLRESYVSDIIGRLGRSSGLEHRFGWGLEYDRNYTKYNQQEGFTSNVGRGILYYQVTPEFQVSGRGGYENNNYSINPYSGAIYGAGLDWRPTARTNLDGFWEHRFFGDSYSANFQHRHRLTGFRLTGFRGVTTSPQQLTLGTGLAYDVVDAAFTSRIPDPAQRQQAVLQFLQQTGLPPILTQPLSFYSNQVLLEERVEAAVSFNGARNNVVVTVYWTDREPITGSGTPIDPILATNQAYVQKGASVSYTYRLSGNSSITTLALRSQTRAKSAALPGVTDYTVFRVVLDSRLSPRTTWFAGGRYQWQDRKDTTFTQYREAAVFAGIDYTYH